LGFLGVGWIGRHRMDAIASAGAGTVVAVADVDPAAAAAAAAPHGAAVVPPEQLMARQDLDGVVIATPSALHAQQAAAALDRGLAVFCQKPLARTAAECAVIIEAARRADRLLGVDLSYRHLAAVQAVRDLLDQGVLGEVYAVELTFANAYGPDKPWFTDPARSGGGAVIDLGIHLVDLALWLLGRPRVVAVHPRLYARGRLLGPDPDVVEDHAIARLDLATGGTVNLTCSWFGHAGVPATIEAVMHGTTGAAAVQNVAGSFYDFRAEHRTGTSAVNLVGPPDDWGGRAAVAWAHRLSHDPGYDPAVADIIEVATVLDAIYRRPPVRIPEPTAYSGLAR
jgi:predicted dehydrogenase